MTRVGTPGFNGSLPADCKIGTGEIHSSGEDLALCVGTRLERSPADAESRGCGGSVSI